MGKLCFNNKVIWDRSFMRTSEKWDAERKRWAERARITIVGDGTPWGNDYHQVNIYTSEKGLEAWDDFTSDVLKNGTPDA